MNYRIEDLIDVEKVQSLMDGFLDAVGLGSALLNREGTILASTGWQDICAKFHRVCPETAKRCRKSDTALADALAEGGEYNIYECLNGMIDLAIPIIVEGQHVGNLFTGQFFFKAPDREIFRRQAEEYGFDEEAYLEALDRVPILPESTVKAAVGLLVKMTGMLGDMGLDRIKQIELRGTLEENQEELKREKDFTDATLNTLDETFFVFDLNGRFIRWNDAMKRVTGYDDRKIESMAPTDFFVKEDRVRVADAIEAVLKNGFARVEARLITGDGKNVPFETSGTLLKDGEGNPVAICGIGRDISERKKFEEKLVNASSEWRSTFDAVTDPLCLLDPDGKILRCNHAMKTFLGKSYGEIIGRKCFELVHGTSKPVKECPLPAMKKNLRREMVEILEGDRWYRVIVDPILDEKGELKGVVHIMTDITEYKQVDAEVRGAKEYMAQVINAIGDPVFVKDEHFKFVLANDALCALLGIAREKLLGTTGMEILPADQMDHFLEVDKKVLETGEKDECEELLTRFDGSIGTIVTVKTRYINDQGTKFIVGAIRDITDRKRVEKELLDSGRRFRLMFESMPSAAAIYRAVDDGADFVFSEFNAAAERIENIKRDEVLGKRVTKIFPGVEEFGLLAVFRRVWRTGESETHPITQYRDKRLTGWRENQVVRLPSGEIAAIYEDITERIKGEEEIRYLSEIVTQSTESIVCTDTEFKINYINQASIKLFGWTFDELQGKPVDIFNAEPTLPELQQRLYETVASGEAFLGESLNRKKDGSTFYCQFKVSPLVDQNGKIMGYMGSQRDITERIRAEEELARAADDWQNTFDAAKDAIWIISRDHRILRSNRAGENFFQCHVENIIGKNCWEIVHDPAEPHPECPARRARESLRRETMELQIAQKWFQIVVDPILDTAGKYDGAVHIIRDITEQKRAEETQLRIKNLLEMAGRLADFGGWSIILAENRVIWSDQVVAIHEMPPGYSPTLEDGLNFYAPEWKDKITRVFGACAREGQPYDEEMEIITAGGKRRWIRTTGRPARDEEGKIVRVEGAFQDITKSKQAAEKLKEALTIINRSPVVTFTWRNETGWPVEYVSENVMNLLGYTTEEWTSGKVSYIDIIYPDDQERVAGEVAMYSQEKGRAEFTHEPYRIYARDGSVRWIRDWTFITRDAKGSITHYKGIVQDITKLKQAEEKLLRSREQLHELSRHLEEVREEERKRFSRELHDELGQVLTALKIDVSWLQKRPAVFQNEPISEKINTMMDLIDQTATAVKRISTELRPAMLDDLGLIPAVEWQINEFEKRSKIKCSFSVTPSEVIVEPEISTTIFRILQEALTNILRYAQATRVKISLRATGEEIKLKVKDNGTGIGEENIKDPRSFGLIGMRERLYPFGGTFVIKGRKGKGTTVSIIIPLVQTNK